MEKFTNIIQGHEPVLIDFGTRNILRVVALLYWTRSKARWGSGYVYHQEYSL